MITIIDFLYGHLETSSKDIAIQEDGRQLLTYQDLCRKVDHLAAQLLDKGLSPGSCVAVCVDRSVEMVVCLLAVMKAGGVYVPLDPSYPEERIHYVIEDSGCEILLTESYVTASFNNVIRVDLDHVVELPEVKAKELLAKEIAVSELMYIIYTSGSTGKPKGVEVTHQNVVNFLQSMQQRPGFTSADKLLSVTTIAFDIAVLEIFLPLVSGGTVEIASKSMCNDAPLLLERLNRGDITVMQATPTTWRMLIQFGWGGSSKLKALVGGEALPSDILPELISNTAELWNMYGPTETTVWSTCAKIDNPDAPIIIGSPINNTQVYVVSDEGQLIDDDKVGELWIGGDGVTQGYHGKPDLTEKSFIENPWDEKAQSKLFKTGDLARWCDKDNLQCLGRIDHQVKLRGFRIELGEIEAVVAQHQDIIQCVVHVVDIDKSQQLVAYLRATSEAVVSGEELAEFAAKQLPEYMVPFRWVFLEVIPLTPNGKIDRKALPQPGQERPKLKTLYVVPQTDFDRALSNIWCELLNYSYVGMIDSFESLGGTDLKAKQCVARIEKLLATSIPSLHIESATSIEDVSKFLLDNIDVKRLKQFDFSEQEKSTQSIKTERPKLAQAYAAPTTDTEKELVDIWSDLLGIDNIGVHDRFFELGGSSIKAIQFVDRYGKHIGQKIPMPSFFSAPTISDFAKVIADKYGNVPDSSGAKKPEKKQFLPDNNNRDVAEDIAIIGMSCRLPGASNTEEFWKNLHDGVESRYEVTAEDLIAAGLDPKLLDDPNYIPICMPLDNVEDFDAEFFGYRPREAELMDPQQRIFLESAWSAMEDAGYTPSHCHMQVGIFGGVARNAYQLHNIASQEELRINSGDYHILLGNDKDFLVTRVAYKMNLTGPAMSVQTACSASGVALHLARQSLLNNDCKMAIVGGGRIMSPHRIGYHYVDGNVLSADGHVNAFDEKASGMVRGSGMSMVVLKRLSDAVEDKDFIHAVLKSTAVTNDGATKASFTAPAVDGQASAIKRAVSDANVNIDSISYIEAHGTGTRLGDPIELAALTEAFEERTLGNQYCPIGSSKTNVGHLDAGACVTGVIKTALSMRHRKIPASLNYQKPNPLIDFENSPFYVNHQLSDWDTEQLPRRAGVSTFGVGGTNAHVVMEEAPEREESSESRPNQLLLLSGKTASAACAAADELSVFLQKNSETNLADVAFTLQTAREKFEHRVSLSCDSTESAIVELQKIAAKKKTAETIDNFSIVFMFPGQGSQHIDMARTLYEQEPVFQVHVDHCCRYLIPIMDLDLRELIYPGEGADTQKAAEELMRTEIAQPVLFVIEYSLAKLWISWGIKPDAMIGHSVGEYVAAALSGVLTLDDALSLMVTRGQLMNEMPAGDMVAVRVGVDKISSLLNQDASLAASNAPNISVISGSAKAINKFCEQAQEKGIDTIKLHTSHAFHSSMMDPILQPFTDAVAEVRLNKAKIPFISSLTGEWITDEQSMSPEYWAQQLRNAVLFSKGVDTLLETDGRVLIEVGPSNALSTSARQHRSNGKAPTVITTLSSAQKPIDAQKTALKALGELWQIGAQPDWVSFYASEDRHRISLPTYPFQRKRYWIDPPGSMPNPNNTDAEALAALMAEEQDASSVIDINDMSVEAQLVRALTEVTGTTIAEVEYRDTFLELGFDSLLLTQISAKLQQAFGVALQFEELIEDYNNVETISVYLKEHLPEDFFKQTHQLNKSNINTVEPASPVAAVLPRSSSEDASYMLQVVQEQMQLIRELAGLVQDKNDQPQLNKLNKEPHDYVETSSDSDEMNADCPPLPNAKLGRDKKGSPKWFVPDPDKPGGFLRVDDCG